MNCKITISYYDGEYVETIAVLVSHDFEAWKGDPIVAIKRLDEKEPEGGK